MNVNSTYKKVIIIIGVIFFLVVVIGIVWWQKTKTPVSKYTGSLEKVTLQLKWLHQAQFAGFYAAAQQGFYRDEGLDVSIIPVAEDLSESSVVDRVARGVIQFGDVGADQVILARAENKPIKAVSVIYQQSPVVLAALKDSGIKEPKDLIGKKMAVEKGQNTNTVYNAMMKRAGVDTTKIKEVTAPIGLEALAKGQADARMIYLTNEALEVLEDGHALNIMYPEDYGLQFYADTLITNDYLINNNSDLVARFVRASLKGWNWAVVNPKEAGALALIYDPNLSLKHEVDMMQASLPLIYTGKTEVGGMSSSLWQVIENILLEQGLIKKNIPLEDIFTTKFLSEQS